MKYGTEGEKEVLEYFNEKHGLNLKPEQRIHFYYPWLRCSYDGYSMDKTGKKVAVEIKHANKKDHELAKKKEVPEKYYPQLQHQILVEDLDGIYYCSRHKADIVDFYVSKNQAYINNYFDKAYEFWDRVKRKDCPPKPESKEVPIK
jgi:YqaJ viral recombinase family.